MKWSPPRIAHHRRMNDELFLACRCIPALLILLSCGCSTFPAKLSSGNTANRLTAGSVTTAVPGSLPDFDIVPQATAQATAVPDKPATVADQRGPSRPANLSAPKPVESTLKPEVADRESSATAAKSATEQPKPTSVALKEPEAELKADAARTAVAAAQGNSATPEKATPRTSPSSGNSDSAASGRSAIPQKPLSGVVVTPPKAFAWEREGRSAGGRSFLTISPGDGGYRTLVAGSLGGNDPLALELVELLAKRLHEDSMILGGFDCTIVRTVNPDGEAGARFLNDAGHYLNEMFPHSGEKPGVERPPEVSFLLKKINDIQPQRIVHVRTIKGQSGLIAASSGCQSVAKEAADWLGFVLAPLPEKSRSPGSLERYISSGGRADMITFAIPDSTPRSELWSRYGDALMNLLLSDDIASRETARLQQKQSSADRRENPPGR